MSNCKYKLRKLSVGLVSVGTMFTATTVMANEASQPTAAEVTASPVAVEVPSEEVDTSESVTTSKTEEPQTPTANQPETTSITVETESEEQISEATADSQEEGASLQLKSRSKRSTDSVSEQPQLMEVEKFEVDKEISSLTVKDGETGNPLIKNRDDNQRDIFDISRDVKVNQDGTMDVTLTVKPKEIDKGAEVIVLLDTSKKMTDEDFDTAKENIKKLVTTLTSKSTNESPSYNSRNSVRLIDFYRKIGNSIDLSGWEESKVDAKLQEVRKKAIDDYNGWGVDLQGAIHKAREIFNNEKEKNSGKRQHIVLFSQGEATFSYALGDEAKKKTSPVKGQITSSNATLSWLPIFEYTNSNSNMIDDVNKIVEWAETLGLGNKLSSVKTAIKTASKVNGVLNWIGISPTEYLTLKEYKSESSSEKDFNYKKRVGEGYHNYSFDERKTSDMPLKSILGSQLESAVKPDKNNWLGWALDKLSLSETYTKVLKSSLMKAIESIFYKREDIYYNHNLSAQAEAKMAQDEGIVFYSFDVTNPSKFAKKAVFTPDYPTYSKYLIEKDEKAKKTIEERNKKFDQYLKEMSEGKNFLKDVDDKDKFKDILSEVIVTEKFEDKVNVVEKSWKTSSENKSESVSHTKAKEGWLSTKESLAWKISKDELKKAFESRTPLILSYKLDVNNDKLQASLDKRRNKRSTSTENNDSLTEKIISNKISYKINSKSANGQKLEDVKLTYSKVMVPVPDVDGTIEIPKAPEKRLVDPVLPSQPLFPDMPKYDEAETSYGSSEIIDIEEDTGSGIEMGAASGAISTQENTDPIVEITEDTQPGMSGHSEDITIIEDTKPEKIDTIIGGNVIDFTEDSITHNQYTESGQNSTNESQEIIEDTKPESDTISIGGQSDPIEITEDTLPNVSGRSGDITITEDTKQPEVIIGGQSDPVELSEDTAPGMSGFNEGTVVEEDTRPKLQFHFDNEEPIPTINKAISQTPIARVDNNLPQTGDKDKSEAFFTIAALTVIGAAGLLSKKNRKNQID